MVRWWRVGLSRLRGDSVPRALGTGPTRSLKIFSVIAFLSLPLSFSSSSYSSSSLTTRKKITEENRAWRAIVPNQSCRLKHDHGAYQMETGGEEGHVPTRLSLFRWSYDDWSQGDTKARRILQPPRKERPSRHSLQSGFTDQRSQ